ncbi:Hsp70 family protein [Krasilnikovia sp. MM14-A1004]|uniref:Hsp70 family protein n=1 Tax=Krasilnikovia sp. MM14-A1004 TaxID=3373541 RepID=UPI00399CC854
MPGWSLSIDFGTSNTAAAYRRGSADPAPIKLTDQAHQMPSAVLVTPDGIEVGAKAVRAARHHADGFERSPKRLVGQDTTYLGGRDVPVQSLVAAVLRAVAARASGVGGDDRPDAVLLTYPQDWAQPRRQVLRTAAVEAGFDADVVRLVPEPVAAVAYHAHTTPPPPGATVAVFDFGGGTCDVAVLRAESTDNGTADLRVLASAGADPLGGDVVDHLLAMAVLAKLAERDHGDLVTALQDPANGKALQAFRTEVSHAKHELSENEQARVAVEVGSDEEIVTVTRAEFDELIAPQIQRAVDLTTQTLAQAKVAAKNLHKLYLTGGSSYLLAVQRELTALLGRPPATFDDPKLVVALGAHHAATAPPAPAPGPAAAVTPARPAATPPEAAPARAAIAPRTVPPPTSSVLLRSFDDAKAAKAAAAELVEPDGLSAAAHRVLQVNPALAAALAATPDGPAVIDDLPTLAALMCVPQLLEHVTADPGLIARLRAGNTLLKIPQARPDGVPLPVRVFFGDATRWLAAYGTSAAQRHWAENDAPGDSWAVRTMRTWCTATPQERVEILRRPDWDRWVAGQHLLDAFQHGDGGEPDVIWLPTTIERPAAAPPTPPLAVRPAAPTPQQQTYLHDLKDLYAPPANGLTASDRQRLNWSSLVQGRLGELPATFRCQVELMGEGMTGQKSELLFYTETLIRKRAVVIPYNGHTLRMFGGRSWDGFPIILTPDVVTSIRIRTDWGNAHRRIVVNTSPRPGATCPPSGMQLELRGNPLTTLANRIRAHLGRP